MCSRMAEPGLRAVPGHPLETLLLNSMGRGAWIEDGHLLVLSWTKQHPVEMGQGGRHFHLVSSVLSEIAQQAGRVCFFVIDRANLQ